MFSHFLLYAFVNRVRRRICIPIVRFWRSTWLVQIFAAALAFGVLRIS